MVQTRHALQLQATVPVVVDAGLGAPSHAAQLGFVAALGLGDALAALTGPALKLRYKWPNDLLIGGKKVCGILLEGALHDQGLEFVVAGIGINVNQKEFPGLSEATSLRLACGREFNREDLLRNVLHQFERLYRAGRDEQFASTPDLWVAHSTMIGKHLEVRSNESTLAGIAARIAPDGGLVISTGAGEQTVYAGDVTIRPGEQSNA